MKNSGAEVGGEVKPVFLDFPQQTANIERGSHELKTPELLKVGNWFTHTLTASP